VSPFGRAPGQVETVGAFGDARFLRSAESARSRGSSAPRADALVWSGPERGSTSPTRPGLRRPGAARGWLGASKPANFGKPVVAGLCLAPDQAALPPSPGMEGHRPFGDQSEAQQAVMGSPGASKPANIPKPVVAGLRPAPHQAALQPSPGMEGHRPLGDRSEAGRPTIDRERATEAGRPTNLESAADTEPAADHRLPLLGTRHRFVTKAPARGYQAATGRPFGVSRLADRHVAGLGVGGC
jgi:hypothetical protein